MQQEYGYNISVILKLTNEIKMLKRTMESIDRQTIGKENIQIVFLSNPKCTDKTLKYCEKYMDESDRVILLDNMDMNKVKGSLICILNNGQYWSDDAFNCAGYLFDTSIPKIGLVMEDNKQPVDENTKFYDRADFVCSQAEKIKDEPGIYIFSREYDEKVCELVEADDRLKVARALLGIQLSIERIGIIESCKMYGKRTEFKNMDSAWYTKELPKYIEYAQNKRKEVPAEYNNLISFSIMRQLSYVFSDNIGEKLLYKEIEELESMLKGVLKNLDEYIITKGRLNGAMRRYVFSLKEGKDVCENLEYRNGRLLYNNLIFYNLKDSKILEISDEIAGDKEKKILFKCMYALGDDHLEFYITDDKKNKYSLIKTDKTVDEIRVMNRVIACEKIYECNLPADVNLEQVKVWYCYKQRYCGEVKM